MSNNHAFAPQLPGAAVNHAPVSPGPGAAPILVTGDGQTVSGPLLGSGSGSGGGGGTTGSTTTSSSSSSSPFVINVSYDASVASAPAGFTTAIQQVVQYLESQYTDAVTINVAVGYGECAGYALGSGTLGESMSYLNGYSYSQIASALSADATTATDASAVASLSASSPLSGANYWVSTAEAKALGLMGASSSTDGFVGFSSSYPFTYDNTNGVAAGTYDFFGTAVHEFTEVMGRMMFTGSTIGGLSNSYTPYDLFHYSAAGTRDFSASTPGYFSVDGGKTSLGGLNTNSGGDAGDWGSSMGNDAFNAFSNSGVVNAVSSSDLASLDAIGWNRAGTAAAPSVTVALASDTGISATDGITSNDTLVGVAAAGAVVTVTEGTTVLGTTTANATTGAWSFTPTSLNQGSQTVTASETVSGVTASANLTFTYDTIAPATTIAAATGNSAVQGNGDANTQVKIFNGSTLLGSTTSNSSGAWTYTLPTLAAGTYTLTASETDAAGNTGSASTTLAYAPPPEVVGVAVAGATFTAGTVSTNGALAPSAAIAQIAQSGGTAGNSYAYALSGTNAGAFSLTTTNNVASLSAGQSGVAGATNGAVYNLSVTATDTTTGVSSTAAPLSVIVGSIGTETVNVAGLVGSASTPSFIYGGSGNDTITGAGMTSKLWIAGGAGADTMTGGNGANVYQYGSAGDSTASAMDVITNFHASTDLLNLTGLGTKLNYVGQISGSKLAAGSVGWQVSNGNTFVYVNTSGGAERLSSTNMKIDLSGSIALTSGNIAHA